MYVANIYLFMESNMEKTTEIFVGPNNNYATLNYPKNVAVSMINAENNWKDFRQHICDSISTIAFWKYQLQFNIAQVVESHKNSVDVNQNSINSTSDKKLAISSGNITSSDQLDPVEPDLFTNQNSHNQHVMKNLHERLEFSILQKRLSIKRSFLMMSNIYSQHELIFMPFHQLKASSDQLESNHQNLSQDKLRTSPGEMSYAKVLANLTSISDRIDTISQKSKLVNQKYSGVQES